MCKRILVTGSAGLVGSALRQTLQSAGIEVRGIDLLGHGEEQGDVRNGEDVRAAVSGCDGIVHLAAVSRVIWGERDPDGCWATNVNGLRHVLDAAEALATPPWLIFASSREVYGQPRELPAGEDTALAPVNIYGRSKVEGERLVNAARARGLRGCIVRLSNVYGSTADHVDRVVPAFARAAALGAPLRVDGSGHTFDFTHLDDTTRGLVALIHYLADARPTPPPIHFLTGQPTTLGALASLAVELAGSDSRIDEAPPRNFDVSHFYGSPARAHELLGWKPQVTLRSGLARLIEEFRAERRANRMEVTAS